MGIDPIKLASRRRASVYNEGKLLLANLSVGEQKIDIEKTKGNVKGVVEDFYRIKTNIKTEGKDGKESPMDEYHRTGNKKVLMFDFNWWPLTRMEGEQEDYNDVFLYQLKGCNVACPFCFVDRFNNNGKASHGAQYFGVEEIVDVFVKKRDELRREGKQLNVLRASGGEPSLAPEQWLALLQEVDRRGLSGEVYVQSDTNLTTGPVLDKLIAEGSLDNWILEKVAEYDNFGLLSCFKGTDPSNFAENTGCKPEFFEYQFHSFDMFAEAGIAIYPHLINPNPETLESFMDRLEITMTCEEAYNLVHVFSVGAYGPAATRLEAEARRRNDPEYPQKKIAEWNENTARGEEILNELAMLNLGTGYKEVSRPDIVEDLYRK